MSKALRWPNSFVSMLPQVARIHADEFAAYLWLDSSEFAHEAVNHQETTWMERFIPMESKRIVPFQARHHGRVS
jgi:hypothetical protein